MAAIASVNSRLAPLWIANAAMALAVSVTLGPLATGDTSRYLSLAASIGHGFGFSIDEAGVREPEGFRMPGYPAWLAVAGRISPHHVPLVTLVVQQVGMLLSLAFAMRAARLTLDDRHARVLLALSALYPFTAAAACLLSPEALMAPIITGAWALLCQVQPLRGALAGALIGCAVYLRPNALILAPAVALALLAGREPGRFKSAGALLLGTGLVLLPWAARNEAAFGQISPLPPVGAYGRVLLAGTWEARVSSKSLIVYGATGRADDSMIAAGIRDQIRRANTAIGVDPDTVVALDSYKGNDVRARANAVLRNEALRNIREEPFGYLAWAAIRAVRIWFSLAVPAGLSTWAGPVLWLAVLWGALLAIAGVVGVLHAAWGLPGGSPGTRTGVALLLGFAASLCWAHTEARYTIPARHILLAFASVPFAALLTGALDKLASRSRRTANA